MYEFLLNTLIFNDLLASQVLGKLRHLAPKLFFTQEWFLYFQKIELLAFLQYAHLFSTHKPRNLNFKKIYAFFLLTLYFMISL